MKKEDLAKQGGLYVPLEVDELKFINTFVTQSPSFLWSSESPVLTSMSHSVDKSRRQHTIVRLVGGDPLA